MVEAVAVHVLGRPLALAGRYEVPPVGLEADPALELVPGTGLEVDLRGCRRDQRRGRRGQPPSLLLLHQPPQRTAPRPHNERTF